MDGIHRHYPDEFGPEWVEGDYVWHIPTCACGEVLPARLVRRVA